eukprot:m.270011 g.270011  ORF g.270011 m.270011 type:complete len:181 (+) comp16072_c0_seq1:229-771(+)
MGKVRAHGVKPFPTPVSLRHFVNCHSSSLIRSARASDKGRLWKLVHATDSEVTSRQFFTCAQLMNPTIDRNGHLPPSSVPPVCLRHARPGHPSRRQAATSAFGARTSALWYRGVAPQCRVGQKVNSVLGTVGTDLRKQSSCGIAHVRLQFNPIRVTPLILASTTASGSICFDGLVELADR